jgi:hypothetical protein
VTGGQEKVLAKGRFSTGRDGYKAMLATGRNFRHRTQAVEGCGGIGRHIAQRLLADGETVPDVPAKLSARALVFATGQGCKTDPVDAHSVAVVALHTDGLQSVVADGATVALRLCVPKTSSTPCGQPIFVDQATGASVFPDAVLVEIGRLVWRFQRRGCVQGAVRPVLIVVGLVIAQDPPQVGLVPDEGAVQEFAAASPIQRSGRPIQARCRARACPP